MAVIRQWLKIDATAVFFPITVAGRLQAASTADLRTGFRPVFRKIRLIRLSVCLSGIAARMVLLHHPSMVNPLSMPFKLNFSPGKPFALSNHALIRIHGVDAGAFLQAQCMNDVKQLGDGDWQYNGWLNPQGRVMALFYLVRVSIDDFCMIVPELPAEPLLASLERFKFRSKVNLSVDSSRRPSGTMLPANSGQPAFAAGADTREAMTLKISGRLADRILSIAPTAAAEDPEAMDQWHCLDMAAGWIWLSGSLQNRWTPQMLSLDRLHAFSLKKGCYPGQEIVARTHYLGKSKRQLQSVQGIGLQTDQSLSAGGQEFGVVVNSNATGSFAVAVVPADAPPEPWSSASGTAVSPVTD